MSKYAVIGKHGLLGSALARQLGDVTSFPTDETRVVFHFGSYTHGAFELNPAFHQRRAYDEFAALLPWCREHDALFVYPSSALVYEKDTNFAQFKRALEAMAASSGARTLGCRIFPVYGIGETRSVIAQWCRAMSKGERPVVWGDGSQKRDFIFADDAAAQIISMARTEKPPAIFDIGTGRLTPFLEIVERINAELGARLDPEFVRLDPEFVRTPPDYSEGIACRDPLPAPTHIAEGIRKVLASL